VPHATACCLLTCTLLKPAALFARRTCHAHAALRWIGESWGRRRLGRGGAQSEEGGAQSEERPCLRVEPPSQPRHASTNGTLPTPPCCTWYTVFTCLGALRELGLHANAATRTTSVHNGCRPTADANTEISSLTTCK